jgi:hypothetical protein
MLQISLAAYAALASIFLLLVQKKDTKKKDTLDTGLTLFGFPRSSKKWALAVNSVALLPQSTARVIPFFSAGLSSVEGVSPLAKYVVSRRNIPLRLCRGAQPEEDKPRRCLSERCV